MRSKEKQRWGISVNDELLEREQTTPKLSIRGGFPWMPPNIAVKTRLHPTEYPF